MVVRVRTARGRSRRRAGSAKPHGLCHPVSVTYDPGRRTRSAGGLERRDPESTGRVPVLRNEWREPLRAQRDPLAEDSGRARSNRDDRRRWRKQSGLGRFVSTYGWRAYALPVLVALTVWWCTRPSPAPARQKTRVRRDPCRGRRRSASSSTAIIGAPPKGLTQFDANLPTGILPDGGPYTEAGAKTWHIVPGNGSAGRRGHHEGLHLHRRGRGRHRHHVVSAVTRASRGWSARPWPIRRAGRTTRSSRSPASTSGAAGLPGLADLAR